eukprot:COSAG02_NODE_297_length_25355_cov_78.632998_4_plen_78_part_00
MAWLRTRTVGGIDERCPEAHRSLHSFDAGPAFHFPERSTDRPAWQKLQFQSDLAHLSMHDNAAALFGSLWHPVAATL